MKLGDEADEVMNSCEFLSRLSFVLFFFGGGGGVVWVSFYLSSGALIFILGNVFGSFMT